MDRQFAVAPVGFVTLMGRLTALVSNTTIILVDYGEALGSQAGIPHSTAW